MYCFFGGGCFFVISWLKIKCLQTLYFGYIFETIKQFSVDQSIHFIYTVPFEIIEINFQFCLFLSCVSFLVLFLETFLNFFKSSFFFKEYFFCLWVIVVAFLLLYIYNSWVFYEGLAFLIFFFKTFLDNILNLTSFNLFLELKLIDYVHFIKICFFYLQLLYIVFLVFYVVFNLLLFNTILFYKLYFIYIKFFILILISPQELLTVILICTFFYLSFEVFILVLSCYVSFYTFYISTFYKKLK